MNPTMPKTFKPDPLLSAQSAQRIMKKAEQQQTSNPDQAMNAQGENKALKAAGTAMEVASYLPVGPQAKIVLAAGAMAANKLSESDQPGDQGGLKNQVADKNGSVFAQNDPSVSVNLNQTEDEQMARLAELQEVARDISGSVPATAQSSVLSEEVQQAREAHEKLDQLLAEDRLSPS